jgi:hypothetical protein
MILLTHNMLASPMKEAAKQLPLGCARTLRPEFRV